MNKTKEQGRRQLRQMYNKLTYLNGKPPQIQVVNKGSGYDVIPAVSVGEANIQAARAYQAGAQRAVYPDGELRKLVVRVGFITHLIDKISDIIVVVDAGGKIRAYLQSKQAHNKLIGAIHSIKMLLDAQRGAGRDLLGQESETHAKFTTWVE